MSPAGFTMSLALHIGKTLQHICQSQALHEYMPYVWLHFNVALSPAMHQLFSRHPLLRAGPKVSVLHRMQGCFTTL